MKSAILNVHVFCLLFNYLIIDKLIVNFTEFIVAMNANNNYLESSSD